ncbi:HAD-IA family hydrolase [Microbacterium sp. bgisy203]|uniref:HAD-IA family hydrolase n=1 Tax=Microbacterium sp. bgisy203 TaxID=3413799 RepID=UPI003D72D164
MPRLASRPLVRRDPEDLGIPAPAFLALADRLEEEGLDPHALLVARHGEVAFETAWAPYRLDRPALVYSASKTFTSLAIGFLADEGRLSLDGDAGAILGVEDPAGITVRHLLTMNTGHSGPQIDAIGDDPRRLFSVAPEHAPGTHFAYNSPATHALSAIVTALTGDPLTVYLRPRLLDPLGIGDRWMRPFGGIEHGASGFHLTVEDLARTAIMLGDGGVVDGAGVVPAWYVEELSRPWSDTAVFDGPAAAEGEVGDWSLGYGYQVWRGRHGFRLDGAAGQFGLVLPEQGLVIAYQGATFDTQATLRAFWAFVEAVEIADAAGGAGPESPASLGEPRDTWDARETLVIYDGVPLDTEGLVLVDDSDGWVLTLPGVGEFAVGSEWRETVFGSQENRAPEASDGHGGRPASENSCDTNAATHLTLATRGEERSDGSVLVHVVDTTSPHRVIVVREPDGGEPDGALRAGWHVPPLGGGWAALRVPASVTGTAVPTTAAAEGVTTHAAALLLDMDGTLVDSHAVVERLWTEWSLAHDVDPERTLAIIHGRQGQDSMAMLLPDRPHEVNVAENRELLAAETAQTEGVVAIDGASALLEDLEHLPHALVTSATRELAAARMGAAGLRMPQTTVTAEDVARSKPDPEGFVAAAGLLGVDPADCIVVEDSPNGIAAGLAAGMRVIGVGAAAEAAADAPDGATWVVPDASGIRVSPAADGGLEVTIAP